MNERKTGWLLVNGFLKTEKFDQLYTYLQTAAQRRGIELLLKTSDETVCPVGEEGSLGLPAFVLFWDKDVSLARRIERLGVPVFNGARAVEICDNKILTAETLCQNGVATPKTIPAPKTFEGIGYGKTEFLRRAGEILGYPMIVKEAYGSFGAQVYLAEDFAAAAAIVERIGHKEFLMQEFIAASRGRDIRANVVGGKVVAAMTRYNERDFRSNVTNGGKTSPVTLTAEQEKLALDACAAIGLDFAGVDILTDGDGKALVCEVNSNPHFKSTLDCTGVDLSEHIMRYIAERV